jgi:hypothetical protein
MRCQRFDVARWPSTMALMIIWVPRTSHQA